MSSQGLSFSICEMGTCIAEFLYILGSVGAAHSLPVASKYCRASCSVLWVKTPDGKLSQITSCLALPSPAHSCVMGTGQVGGHCVSGWIWGVGA